MNLKVIAGNLLSARPIGRLVQTIIRTRSCADFSIDLRSLPPSVAAGVAFGLLERAERRLISRFLPSGLPVVELGSAFGVVTQAIANRTRAERQRIVCVEANPELAAYLARQVSCSSRIEVIHAAVVPREIGSVCLDVDPGGLGSRVSGAPSHDSVMVPSVTFEQIVRRYELDRFSVVCDIEGMEFSVFGSFSEDLWSRCQAIICELHPFPSPAADKFLKLAEIRGFRLVGVDRFSVALVRP